MRGVREWFSSGPREVVAVVAVMALAVAMYWPSIRAPFVSDDYAFLWVVRDMSWRELLQSVLGDRDVRWTVVSYSWRPLSLLTFAAIHALVGESPAPFHLVLLAGHLSAIALLWCVARRLGAAPAGAAVAAIVFGLHPTTIESVAWIASISSLALPIGLAGWLVLLRAGEDPAWERVMVACLLVALAAAFRETIGALVVPILAVQVLRAPAGTRRRAALRLSPIVLLPGAIALVSKIATTSTPSSYGDVVFDGFGERMWRLLRGTLVPSSDPGSMPSWAGTVAAGCLIAFPVVLLIVRAWTSMVLVLSFHLVVAVHAAASVETSRFLYVPVALLGLSLSVLPVRRGGAPAGGSARRRTAAAIATAGLALVAVVVGHRNVATWASAYPVEYERFRDQLAALDAEITDGTTLYVANLPFSIRLYDGHNVAFVADHVWPGRHVESRLIEVQEIAARRARLGDDEALVVYDPSTGACAAQRAAAATQPRAIAVEVSRGRRLPAATRAPIARIGPYDDTWGTISIEIDGARQRVRADLPWLAPMLGPWRPLEEGRTSETTVVTSATDYHYDVVVDGETTLRLRSLTTSASGSTSAVRLEGGPFGPTATGVVIRPKAASPCDPST